MSHAERAISVSAPHTEHDTELAIQGMTCASCANRIERKLNKLEGVTASVNYATEKATVHHPPGVSTADLLAGVEAAGYSAALAEEAGDEGEDELNSLRRRLRASVALSVPVIILAMVPGWQFPGWQWISLVLATPVVLWAAAPFHRAAWTNLRHRATTMDTLISLGVLAAYSWSLVALTIGSAGEIGMVHPFEFTPRHSNGLGNIYLEAASGVTTFLLAGRYFEKRSKRRAGEALRALMELGPREVTVLRGGRERRVPADTVKVGDLFVLRPGEQVATDGIVTEGASAVDVSLLTGESVPVEAAPGSEIVGGCINTTGRLVVRATRVGADTQLAQMARLVEEAQSGKAEVQRLADRVSAVFVPIVITLSMATLTFWLAVGSESSTAFSAAVAVLIIACPCALGLATPTALLVGTGRGAQLGILIRGPEVLESTRRVDTMVLDKTGTLTTGRMSLISVVAANGESEQEVRRVAASVESASEHPIARAIAAGWPGETRLEVTGFTNREGLGVEAVVEGRQVFLGRPGRPSHGGVADPPVELARAVDQAEARGHTAVVIGWDGSPRGVLVVADTVRETSAEAVARFRDLGLEPVLLTGDNERAARAVAAQVGIDRVVAHVLPAGKADEVVRLQDAGRVVAMVGDGINDAPALATADLGLAMGTGTDVAIQASDLTLVRGDLLAAVDAIRLARRTLATIKGNLFWAFAYNILALPLAAAGLLTPMIAGAAMALSSVFVVSNSLRLRRFS